MKKLIFTLLIGALPILAFSQTTNIPNTSWQWENHSNWGGGSTKFLGFRMQGIGDWPVLSILHEKPYGSTSGANSDRQTTLSIRSRRSQYMGQLRMTTLNDNYPHAVVGSGNNQKSFGIRYWKSWNQMYQHYEVKNNEPKNLYLLDHAAGGDKVVVRGDLCLNANGSCDYVFQDNYKLDDIEDLEQFIKENKHLPGVKSDADIKEAGEINTLELSFSLLEKVEELTLYTIDQHHKIEALKSENNTLSDNYEELKKINEELQEQLQKVLEKLEK